MKKLLIALLALSPLLGQAYEVNTNLIDRAKYDIHEMFGFSIASRNYYEFERCDKKYCNLDTSELRERCYLEEDTYGGDIEACYINIRYFKEGQTEWSPIIANFKYTYIGRVDSFRDLTINPSQKNFFEVRLDSSQGVFTLNLLNGK
jgi:hypothetical protein